MCNHAKICKVFVKHVKRNKVNIYIFFNTILFKNVKNEKCEREKIRLEHAHTALLYLLYTQVFFILIIFIK